MLALPGTASGSFVTDQTWHSFRAAASRKTAANDRMASALACSKSVRADNSLARARLSHSTAHLRNAILSIKPHLAHTAESSTEVNTYKCFEFGFLPIRVER